MYAHSLTPRLREAVRAAWSAPGHKLVRCPGGYSANGTIVSRRVVNMLDRDYVFTYQGDMQCEAVLTSKGERIASELAKAGGQ